MRIAQELKIDVTPEKRLTERDEYTDIYFEYDSKKYAIELKYKTRKPSEESLYKNQGGQPNGKYDFLKDVKRLERLKKANNIDQGFAILITNDRIYWRPAEDGSKVKEFDLVNGSETKALYTPKWTGRTGEIKFKDHYKINWFGEKPDKGVTCSFNFRYAIVEV